MGCWDTECSICGVHFLNSHPDTWYWKDGWCKIEDGLWLTEIFAVDHITNEVFPVREDQSSGGTGEFYVKNKVDANRLYLHLVHPDCHEVAVHTLGESVGSFYKKLPRYWVPSRQFHEPENYEDKKHMLFSPKVNLENAVTLTKKIIALNQ